MSEDRLTEIEIALAYDRRIIEELDEALVDANRTIDALTARVKRLEELLSSVAEQVQGAPANEKPPHY